MRDLLVLCLQRVESLPNSFLKRSCLMLFAGLPGGIQ
jgi:hypothetical protein